MNKKTVLVVPGSWNYEYVNRLHTLSNDHFSFVYVSLLDYIHKDLMSTPGIDTVPVYRIYDQGFIDAKQQAYDTMHEILKGVGFGELILGEIMHMELGVVPFSPQHFSAASYERSIAYTVEFFSRIVEEHGVEVLLYEGYNSHVSKVLYHICTLRGIPCLFPFGVVFRGLANLVDDRWAFSQLVYKMYKERLSTGNTPINIHVTELIKRVQESKSIYGNFEEIVAHRAKIEKLPLLSVPGKLWRISKSMFRDRRKYDFLDFLMYRQTEKSRLTAILRSRNNNRWYNQHSATSYEAGHAVYFMHFQPEASTHGFAPFYTDELTNIKMIAKALPLGMKLYVKDHPNDSYSRGESYFHSLTYYPNVILLRKEINPIDMIRDAAMVFTVSGTVMVEAAILKRPVIAFSHREVTLLANVRRAKNLESLPQLIVEMLSVTFNTFLNDKERERELEIYLQTVYDTSFAFNGNTKEEKEQAIRNYIDYTYQYVSQINKPLIDPVHDMR